jgi:hypothetical protein
MVAREFPEVTLKRCDANLGFARANNIGLACASGAWLAMINSDVVVRPGCLQHLVRYLEADPRAGLAGPKVFGGDGQLQPTCRRLPTLWSLACRALALDTALSRFQLFSAREMPPRNHDSAWEVEVVSGCFWMVRREAVDEVGGLDERFFFYAEDVDWCKRFWDAGWKVLYVPEATATHFGGGSSGNAPLRYSIEMLRANAAYWDKYCGRAGWAVFYLLSLFHHTVRLILRGLSVMALEDPGSERAYKLKRSRVCLRWLLTGKEA